MVIMIYFFTCTLYTCLSHMCLSDVSVVFIHAECLVVWPPSSQTERTPTTVFAKVWTLMTTLKWRLPYMLLQVSLPNQSECQWACRYIGVGQSQCFLFFLKLLEFLCNPSIVIYSPANSPFFVMSSRDFAAGICNKISEMIQGKNADE